MSRKKLKVTTHARLRARERLGVYSHSEVNKRLNDALTYGQTVGDYRGDFAEFLKNKKNKCKIGVSLKVYMETLVFYKGKTVLTTYKVPKKFVPTSDYLAKNYINDPWLGKLCELVGRENVDYKVFPPKVEGELYVTGLYVNDMFENYGMGKSQWKSINHACRSCVKRLLKEEDDKDREEL